MEYLNKKENKLVNLISKVILLDNKKTTIRLANDEWEAINIISQKENIKRNYLIELINSTKSQNINLTSSIRLFSIIYFYTELLNLQKNTSNKQLPITEAIHGII